MERLSDIGAFTILSLPLKNFNFKQNSPHEAIKICLSFSSFIGCHYPEFLFIGQKIV